MYKLYDDAPIELQAVTVGCLQKGEGTKDRPFCSEGAHLFINGSTSVEKFKVYQCHYPPVCVVGANVR